MAQTILNYKIESTNEKLTPRTGVAIFGEYLKGMNFEKLCNKNILNSLSSKAYDPFEFIFPLILMLHSGGRVLDDIKEIRLYEALKMLLKIENIPTAGTVTKYLHRHGSVGELGMKNINKSYLKRFLKSIKNEAHKHNTLYSYLGDPGYMPMIGHINGGYVIDADFREGNEAPAAKNLEFIKSCALQLPIGTTFDRFRADSASYQAEIFNYCDKEKILFTVSGQKDKSVMYEIENINEEQWEKLNDREQVAASQGHFLRAVYAYNDQNR